MKYKFIGKPDFRFPRLVTGNIYNLTITYKYSGICDFLLGIRSPKIIDPIVCLYSNEETFNNNWEKQTNLCQNHSATIQKLLRIGLIQRPAIS